MTHGARERPVLGAERTLPAQARIDVATIDRFTLDAPIGKGGMAVVFSATDKETGARVAVKVMQKSDAHGRDRFHREVKAASMLLHPGICRVIAYGVDDDKPFLAMEFVEGVTLFQLIKQAPVFPGSIAAEVLRQLLEALACAHKAGVVHRDVKPHNLMITPSGTVKLLDFGIARSTDDETLTATGILVGTPAFMSPEQAKAEEMDARSDLFSAAITIASALRKSPHRFGGGTKMDPTQMLLRVAFEPPGPVFEKAPHTPIALDYVLASMSALHVDNRVPSAGAALVALRESAVLPLDGPALLAKFVNNPAGVSDDECAKQKQRDVSFATAIAARDGGAFAAALAFHRAWHCVPDDDVAAKSRAHCQKHTLSFDEPTNDPRLDELHKAYSEQPTHPGILKGLADRYRALGRPKQAAAFLWRYLAEKPNDVAASQQLAVMLEGPGASTDVAKKLSTKSIIAGIKSGGLKKPVIASAGIPTRSMARPERSPNPPVGSPDSPLATLQLPTLTEPNPTAFNPRAVGGSQRIASSSSSESPSFSSESSALPKAAFIAVVVVAIAIAVYFAVSTVVVAKQGLAADSKSGLASQATTNVGAKEITATVSSAEAKLADDPEGALADASQVLIEHPSLEAGRSALWVRARAEAALGKRDAALKDCEQYLEKATQFDDPHIMEVKSLMSKLRSSSSSAAVLR